MYDRAHDPRRQAASDPSSNPHFAEVAARRLPRRAFLQGSVGTLAAAFIGVGMTRCDGEIVRPPGGGAPDLGRPDQAAPLFTFRAVAASDADRVTVPPGYSAAVLCAWGDPISDGPAFALDASQGAAEQELQAGMHHDGMHFFPLPDYRSTSSERGLLAINHEYLDAGLLFPDGTSTWTAAKARKALAALGVSIIEVEREDGVFRVVRPSRYARRVTGATPHRLSGPAAGHALVQTAADPAGQTVLGTLNNCAGGHTPWGTYLTCEENFNEFFANTASNIPAQHRRYGIGSSSAYRLHEVEPRFDAAQHPNEPNRFGWVVEVDPYTPGAQPVKRTALGRCKHESATVTLARDGRVVVYTGDDERFEYIYKFVSRGRYHPTDRQANRDLLDDGTLYVARFDDDGGGRWLELSPQNPQLPAVEFPDLATILVNARAAADRAGATRMDRPEWIAVQPGTGAVYATLTNNGQRGATDHPSTDKVNPRVDNQFGHIVRWDEEGGDAAATRFRWDLFLQAGNPKSERPNHQGDIQGDVFACPDGLWFDGGGVLWIQTDVSTSVLGTGDFKDLGNNQMLAANPATGEVRRFLVGPRGCEITGITGTPDRRTLFINIQHPGEPSGGITDPARVRDASNWPDGRSDGRPRSATIAVRRDDGGVIGG